MTAGDEGASGFRGVFFVAFIASKILRGEREGAARPSLLAGFSFGGTELRLAAQMGGADGTWFEYSYMVRGAVA